MKYRWSHAVCLTDFSWNQLLCRKTLATFPLSGDFRSHARQRNRSSFTDVHFWTCKYMERKTNACRFCSLITQMIPKVCLSECVFLCLNTYVTRFTLEYGLIFPKTGWQSSFEWKQAGTKVGPDQLGSSKKYKQNKIVLGSTRISRKNN